jgi:hypothetical protein
MSSVRSEAATGAPAGRRVSQSAAEAAGAHQRPGPDGLQGKDRRRQRDAVVVQKGQHPQRGEGPEPLPHRKRQRGGTVGPGEQGAGEAGQQVLAQDPGPGNPKRPPDGPDLDDACIADAGVGVVAQEVGVHQRVHVRARPLPAPKFPLQNPALQRGGDHQDADARVGVQVAHRLAEQEVAEDEAVLHIPGGHQRGTRHHVGDTVGGTGRQKLGNHFLFQGLKERRVLRKYGHHNLPGNGRRSQGVGRKSQVAGRRAQVASRKSQRHCRA